MEKINHRLALIIFVVLTVFLFFACCQPQAQSRQTAGVYHLVKKNETVQLIAGAYGVPLQKLIKINNIADVDNVKEGYVMFIPSATRVIDDIVPDVKIKNNDTKLKVEKYGSPAAQKGEVIIATTETSPEKRQSKNMIREETAIKSVNDEKSAEKKIVPQPRELATEKKMQAGNNRFVWPVRGEVKDTFGVQPNKTFHNWIKITSSVGTKVKAAESGTVIFSSRLKNYGETIIIRHKNNFVTVYTHLKKRYVKTDKNVRKEETIAVVGEKDDAGEAYINFEVRLAGKAHNPLLFLP